MAKEAGRDGNDEIAEVDGKIDQGRLRVAELANLLEMRDEDAIDIVKERPKEEERTDQNKWK